MTLDQQTDFGKPEKIWITHPCLSEPQLGFFSIKLGKGCLPRALMVTKNNDLWRVYLDGERVAIDTISWRQAFGELIARGHSEITGTRISMRQYERLVINRRADVARGLNIGVPCDIGQVQIP